MSCCLHSIFYHTPFRSGTLNAQLNCRMYGWSDFLCCPPKDKFIYTLFKTSGIYIKAQLQITWNFKFGSLWKASEGKTHKQENEWMPHDQNPNLQVTFRAFVIFFVIQQCWLSMRKCVVVFFTWVKGISLAFIHSFIYSYVQLLFTITCGCFLLNPFYSFTFYTSRGH